MDGIQASVTPVIVHYLRSSVETYLLCMLVLLLHLMFLQGTMLLFCPAKELLS